MIKDKKLLEQFEKNLQRKEKADYLRNLQILEYMLEEAIYLKVFPPKDPLEGIEVDIRIASIINSV